jgi:hypothetical protein
MARPLDDISEIAHLIGDGRRKRAAASERPPTQIERAAATANLADGDAIPKAKYPLDFDCSNGR